VILISSEENLGTSFTVPRWGGVTIWNPSLKTNQSSLKAPFLYSPELLSLKDIQSIMEIFLQQMRDMLGLPQIANEVFYGSIFPYVWLLYFF
jgi:hypothetical protein